ncbi:MAG TPA: hypothetical protein PKU89_08990, partial [Kiritimatiellia bacterium]|nr:hypothetical protein [Kiritimatiellia bacterium]
MRLRNGVPTDIGRGQSLDLTRRVATAGGKWARSFPDLSEEDLDRMRHQAAGRRSAMGRKIPDMNLYFRVEIPPGEDVAAVAEE